jgi:hypothetical protein
MQANCSQPAENLNGKRIQAGGYICNQMIDEALMHNADVLRSIDAITGASVPQAEIYRMVARICDQVHRSNKVLSDLKMIYK